MGWLLLLVACSEMPSSGHLFAPVEEAPPAAAPAPAAPDERFAAPAAAPFHITSEELAAKADGSAPDAPAAGADAAPLAPSDAAIAAAPAAPAAAASAGPALPALSVAAQFPVRLVSTLPQAQPPRAVLGLADGSEIVVSPGSVLGPEGLVVMAVLDGRVQLAKVRPAGDHATIEPVELTAQYR